MAEFGLVIPSRQRVETVNDFGESAARVCDCAGHCAAVPLARRRQFVSTSGFPTWPCACVVMSGGFRPAAPQVATRVPPRASAAYHSVQPLLHSFCDPHRAENFPAAIRELLEHREQRATNLLRLATRRCDRRSEVPPLDGRSVPDRQVFGFRNEGQHLDWASRRAFVGLSDSLLADVCRRVPAETNGIIGPQIRHRNSISRNRRDDILLFALLDGGSVRIVISVASSRRGRCLNYLPCQRGRRADNDSYWGPHPADAFPAAVRELLEHPEPRATHLLRLTSRRFGIRTSEVTPLDCPAVPDRQVFDFRNERQHLDWESRPAFVALSDSLLADFCRLPWDETNGVIGPQIRQRNRISRQRRGDILLVKLLDGSPVRIAAPVASSRPGRSLNHVPCRRGQRADNDSN